MNSISDFYFQILVLSILKEEKLALQCTESCGEGVDVREKVFGVGSYTQPPFLREKKIGNKKLIRQNFELINRTETVESDSFFLLFFNFKR